MNWFYVNYGVYTMKFPRMNEVEFSGNVANVTIQNGQYGAYGNMSVAVDDGYFQKGQNGQDGQWVDRTHFIDCKLTSGALKKVDGQVNKGDFVIIKGKLVLDQWQDSQTGQQRSAMKVEVKEFVLHVDGERAKQLRAEGKQQRQQQQPPQPQ